MRRWFGGYLHGNRAELAYQAITKNVIAGKKGSCSFAQQTTQGYKDDSLHEKVQEEQCSVLEVDDEFKELFDDGPSPADGNLRKLLLIGPS